MAELTLTGKVLDLVPTKGEKWVRCIVAGSGRYNEVVMLTVEQAMAYSVAVGVTVKLPVRASVERGQDGKPDGGVVYFGRDVKDSPASAPVK